MNSLKVGGPCSAIYMSFQVLHHTGWSCIILIQIYFKLVFFGDDNINLPKNSKTLCTYIHVLIFQTIDCLWMSSYTSVYIALRSLCVTIACVQGFPNIEVLEHRQLLIGHSNRLWRCVAIGLIIVTKWHCHISHRGKNKPLDQSIGDIN